MPSPTDGSLRIGVLGGAGMLGADLVRLLAERYVTVAITRESYDAHRGESFDVLVNANGNSRRFWANEHPAEDFEASTASVARSLNDFRFGRYIYCSSSDAYADHSSPETTSEDIARDTHSAEPYGFHKWLAERLVEQYAPKHSIFRLAALLGPGLKKGMIYDILRGTPLFVGPDSRLQFITTRTVAEVVAMAIAGDVRSEIMNVGGRGAVPAGDIPRMHPSLPNISWGKERQVYEMNVSRLAEIYPLKTSGDYLAEYLSSYEEENV